MISWVFILIRLAIFSFLLLTLFGNTEFAKDKARQEGATVTLRDGKAKASSNAPAAVRNAVKAANQIAGFPYKRGGGHGVVDDDGFDCSGTVSYVLIKAGLLESPLSSGDFLTWGEAGPGEWITVQARAGHAFLVIGGVRFDTTDHLDIGPGWRVDGRDLEKFTPRHPAGL